ncbi:MAG: hypothetical protein QUT30_10645 [Acidobacteriota bacterium]|nr:hypothetical protein [Acidobacteriota bacterium]
MRFFKAIRSLQSEGVARLMLFAGFATGIACFLYYYSNQLTTAHYDAKAHLLVARRMVDSISPGYSQLGVNWLPLIHLVYVPFVLFESQYRSGLLPSLISVCAFAFSGYLAYRISLRLTGSVAAGVFAGSVLLANPNLQYLQSCPMTEPLYMLLMLLAANSFIVWRESGCARLPWLAAVWVSLGAMCRYEGWVFFGGIILLLAFDYWTESAPRRKILQAGGVFLAVFAIPVIAHFGYVYLRLGSTFFGRVAEGYPTPYMTHGRPFLSVIYHLAELTQATLTIPLLAAAAGLLLFAVHRKEWTRRVPLLLLWLPSLMNIAALYWGLIYRVRYSVLLVPAVALFGSLALASENAGKRSLLWLVLASAAFPWLTWGAQQISSGQVMVPGPGALVLPVAALLLFLLARMQQGYSGALILLCILGTQMPPLAREDRAMMMETMEHEFIEPEREEVLRYLRQYYDGRRILIDMGTEAPLVYDSGLPVKEFVYNEGGEALWHSAARNPEAVVGWLCTQPGDAVSRLIDRDANWAANYSIVVQTEHYKLYRLIRDSRFGIRD